jgi:proteasome lid subunit RPN8/RPN11
MSLGATLDEIRAAGLLDDIFEQSRAEYPSEACGLIVEGADGALQRLPCKNLQDEMHARDPEQYPRTSATAYFIDPRIIMDNEAHLRCIYHSHPDHGAYFSAEDQLVAAPFGEPNFPGVSYLVVSVMKGEVDAHKLYAWSDATEQFEDTAAPGG